MSATRTFEYKDADGRIYFFIVKEEFLIRCPDPASIERTKLTNIYELNKYLHSLEGPAVLRPRDDMGAYWIDGKRLSGREEWEKAVINIKFNNKLEDIIKMISVYEILLNCNTYANKTGQCYESVYVSIMHYSHLIKENISSRGLGGHEINLFSSGGRVPVICESRLFNNEIIYGNEEMLNRHLHNKNFNAKVELLLKE